MPLLCFAPYPFAAPTPSLHRMPPDTPPQPPTTDPCQRTSPLRASPPNLLDRGFLPARPSRRAPAPRNSKQHSMNPEPCAPGRCFPTVLGLPLAGLPRSSPVRDPSPCRPPSPPLQPAGAPAPAHPLTQCPTAPPLLGNPFCVSPAFVLSTPLPPPHPLTACAPHRLGTVLAPTWTASHPHPLHRARSRTAPHTHPPPTPFRLQLSPAFLGKPPRCANRQAAHLDPPTPPLVPRCLASAALAFSLPKYGWNLESLCVMHHRYQSVVGCLPDASMPAVACWACHGGGDPQPVPVVRSAQPSRAEGGSQQTEGGPNTACVHPTHPCRPHHC